MRMIADAAGIPISPSLSAAATCGRFAGRCCPVSVIRGAVASPTVTVRTASPTLTPVVAEINVAGVRNPCFRVSPSRPSSGRDCRPIS